MSLTRSPSHTKSPVSEEKIEKLLKEITHKTERIDEINEEIDVIYFQYICRHVYNSCVLELDIYHKYKSIFEQINYSISNIRPRVDTHVVNVK